MNKEICILLDKWNKFDEMKIKIKSLEKQVERLNDFSSDQGIRIYERDKRLESLEEMIVKQEKMISSLELELEKKSKKKKK